jgi:hypothetical protein
MVKMNIIVLFCDTFISFGLGFGESLIDPSLVFIDAIIITLSLVKIHAGLQIESYVLFTT